MPQMPKKYKKTLVIGIFFTAIFFILLTFIYNIIYISPVIKSRQSLKRAKDLATQLKLINYKNNIAFGELSSLNPSHPSYSTLVQESVKSYQETKDELQNIKKEFDKSHFSGTKQVSSYLNGDFKKTFESSYKSFENNLNLKSGEVDTFNKKISALSDILSYNPYVDLNPLNLEEDKDRETALQKIGEATKGLEKAEKEVQLLSFSQKDEIKSSIDENIRNLDSLKNSINSQNIEEAKKGRENFFTSYKNLFDLSSQVIRKKDQDEKIAKNISDEEKLNSDLDSAIKKIEELEKNLPKDPLSKRLNK